ncbi:MAG: hypothetical protein EXR71_04815 [Myxococcales bacterium]|nr:hypothetical protein [Myxococcales bacterium]
MLMGMLALGACSFGVTDWTACDSPAQCREAFGFGHTCGDTGFCVAVADEPRCEATWPEDLLLRPEEYADVLVVGSLFDHSTDLPELLSARLAVKQADESDGVDGRTVGLVQCSYQEDFQRDGLTADEAALAMADHLVSLGAYAIVGPATSGVTEAVYNGVAIRPLFISPSATSPALTYLDAPDRPAGGAGLLWRTAPPDSLQGKVLADQVAAALGTDDQHIALVYQLGPYGEGLAQVFVENWASVTHIVDRLPYENDTQRASAASAAADATYAAIVFISSDLPDVSSFLASLAADGDVPNTPIFLADAARDAELLSDTVDTDAEALWPNIRITSPAVPSGNQYDAFAAAYSGAFDGKSASDSSYAAYAYDAAWLTLYGASWALAEGLPITSADAAAGLRHLSDKAADRIELGPVDWNRAQAAFAEYGAIDAVGASGELDFDPETEETAGPIEVWGIRNDGEPEFYVTALVAP